MYIVQKKQSYLVDLYRAAFNFSAEEDSVFRQEGGMPLFSRIKHLNTELTTIPYFLSLTNKVLP